MRTLAEFPIAHDRRISVEEDERGNVYLMDIIDTDEAPGSCNVMPVPAQWRPDLATALGEARGGLA
jgi:hypothetical protein